ncbi:MAG TPA: hypothetical protein V6D00_09730 [Pantanalinema sp.]
MTPDTTLKEGAKARLAAARSRIDAIVAAIAEHEREITALRAQLPDLQFEEAAMRYIVEGTLPQAPSAPAAPTAPRRKLSRSELIAVIKDRMAGLGHPVEVGDLHAYLEQDEAIDLGANARNYLCGVLSRNKDTHFASLGKGEWWLAGHHSL